MTDETVIAVVADLHCGSTVGLIKEGQWAKQAGGYYNPSAGQKLLWKQFQEAWQAVSNLRKNKRLVVVHLGDATEGIHHAQTELITNLAEEQERIHVDCMDWALRTAKFGSHDELYYVGGTQTHVGSGFQAEERIARDLEAIPYLKPQGEHDGRFIHDTLTIPINGRVFFFAHELFRVGNRAWTEDNNIRLTLKDIYWKCLEAGAKPCDWYLSAHIHRYFQDVFIRSGIELRGVICPSFQLKTEYAMRKFPLERPTLGMLVFAVDKVGHVTLTPHTINYQEKTGYGNHS